MISARVGAFAGTVVSLAALGACSSSSPGVVRSGSSVPSSAVPSSSAAPTTSSAAASTSASVAVHPVVTVTPATGLAASQTVRVTASGFSPGEALTVLECASKGTATGPGDCNLSQMLSVSADATGHLTVELPVVRGPFGSNKIVCGTTQACLVSVTQASLSPTEEADTPITFAAG